MTDDKVTLQRIYDRMDRHRTEFLAAIEKVNGSAQANAVAIGKLETKIEGLDTKMDAFERAVGSLKTWDKIVGAIGAIVGPAVATAILWIRGDK